MTHRLLMSFAAVMLLGLHLGPLVRASVSEQVWIWGMAGLLSYCFGLCYSLMNFALVAEDLILALTQSEKGFHG